MEALALSFEAPMTLLGPIPSSVRCSALRLLNGHRCLEIGHLGHQQTDLRPSQRRLFHKPLLGHVNPSDSDDQTLTQLRLHPLGGFQLLTQALYLCLRLGR